MDVRAEPRGQCICFQTTTAFPIFSPGSDGGQCSVHSVCHGSEKVVKVDDTGSEWLKVSERGGENGLK